MVEIKLKINSVEVLKKINTADKEFRRQMDEGVNDLTDFIFTRSQEYVPVDTGHMARTAEKTKLSFGEYEIVYTTGYAVDVEFGTFTMIRAHGEHDPEHPVTMWEAKRKRGSVDQQQMPFLRPAIEEGKQETDRIFKKRMRKIT